MKKHGKKYVAAREQVEDRAYALDEALPLVDQIRRRDRPVVFAQLVEGVETLRGDFVDCFHA